MKYYCRRQITLGNYECILEERTNGTFRLKFPMEMLIPKVENPHDRHRMRIALARQYGLKPPHYGYYTMAIDSPDDAVKVYERILADVMSIQPPPKKEPKMKRVRNPYYSWQRTLMKEERLYQQRQEKKERPF